MEIIELFAEQELSIAKNPTDFDLWWAYLDLASDPAHRIAILQRAVSRFPRSYEIWSQYLDLKVLFVADAHYLLHKEKFQDVNELFERCLTYLNLNHLVWVKYLQFLLEKQHSRVTFIRRVFNKSLWNLPRTQHHHIWPQFLRFADAVGGPTAILIYSRFLQFAGPDNIQTPQQLDVLFPDMKTDEIPTVELIIGKLFSFSGINEGLELFRYILDRPEKFGLMSKSQHELWLECLDLLLKANIDVATYEELVSEGIKRFPDQMSRFVLKRIFFHTRSKNFLKARSIYYQAIKECVTVKDFTTIFDSFTEFEERMLSKMVQSLEKEGIAELTEVSLRMDFLEHLLDQRRLLLNDLKLKQDKNNMDEWFERVELYENDPNKMLHTFAQALTTINPLKAYSISSNPENNLPNFWIRYARVYAESKDYKTASLVFQKSIQSQFANPDDLVTLYIEWCQLEMEAGNVDLACEIISNACTIIPNQRNPITDINYNDKSIDIHLRVHKSIKLWQFYMDFLQSLVDQGNEEEMKKVEKAFSQLLSLKIITPMDILNQATFLEEWKYFERSFAVYELGINTFKYPAAFDIWKVYLNKAISFKLNTERIRDLFEQCLHPPGDVPCPADMCKEIYIMYSDFEHHNGLLLRSIKILNSCVQALNKSLLEGSESKIVNADKVIIYKEIVSRVEESRDIGLIRELFESILKDDGLPTESTARFTQKFIEYEISQNEISRARALYKFLVQLLPRREENWKYWEEFEVKHGSEISFKEILRLKRSLDHEIGPVVEPTGFVKLTDNSQMEIHNPDEIELDM